MNPRGWARATVAAVYHAILTRRYLTSKIMPLLASLAVMLCTGMVVIVWSVMGGFLTHLIGSGRSLVGDAQVEVTGAGFGHYEELRKKLEAMPEVEATSAAILTQGIVVVPDGRRELVLIRGIDGPSFAKVSGYNDALWWKPLTEPMRKDLKREDPRLEDLNRDKYTAMQRNGEHLETDAFDGSGRVPAAILGIEVTRYNERHPEGYYTPRYGHNPAMMANGMVSPQIAVAPLGNKISLHVMPIDKYNNPSTGDTQRLDLPIANEFQTGMYEVDRKTVLVKLEALQKALRMDKAISTTPPPPAGSVVRGPDGRETFTLPQTLGEDPARVTTVYVRAKGDVSTAKAVDAFKEKLEAVVAQFREQYPNTVPRGMGIYVSSWRDQNITFIAAVEKELGLTLFLFGLISVVAIFLVLAIFWSMVAEKTKDIGILRAIGASRTGVAWVWVRYGLVIGIVGAIGGGILSYAIVTNINEIHDWMGRALNVKIWDPRVYYFSEIPAKFKWMDAGIVLVCGILSSGIGAFWPAMRAARMDPVRSLRFE